MYYTTGFSRPEIEDLCALVAEVQLSVALADRRDWPPILGLGNSVVIALTYLRRNRVQWELAETYGVSQSTISRAISTVTPLLARALARFVPVAEELAPGRQYIVDGTLLPCWSWASHPSLYSGKQDPDELAVEGAHDLDVHARGLVRSTPEPNSPTACLISGERHLHSTSLLVSVRAHSSIQLNSLVNIR